MPIIAPSKSFEGSELSNNAFGKILIDGVRTVSFKEDKNKDGNFFFILPPYKADRFGKGVSWKTVEVRDNFGIDTKERFSVAPNCPIQYFANQVKLLFPDYAKVEKESRDGKEMKKYPTYGRTVKRVLFNVGYFKQLELGAHILEVPQFGAGDKIEAYSRGKQPSGEDNPPLNDYRASYPVWFQLKKNAVGNPWEVTVEKSKSYPLPEALAYSENLYNLDEVIHYPDPDSLVEKLRGITPTEIFDACMNGFFKNQRMQTIASPGVPYANVNIPATAPVPNAVVDNTSAPVLMPAFSVPSASILPKANVPANTAAPKAQVTNFSNPVNSGMSKDEAKAFLTRPA